MLFLPYINVPGPRISWLVAVCGLLAEPEGGNAEQEKPTGKGVRMGPRALRSSMVLRMVLSRIVSDRAPDEVLMRHIGTWVQNATAAAMVHYFSSRGAASTLAGMVCINALFFLARNARATDGAADLHVGLSTQTCGGGHGGRQCSNAA